MCKIAFALAAAAALTIAAPAQATTTLFSTHFEDGTFGVFTAAGQVGVNTGQDYVNCCGATGTGATLTNHFASFGSGNLPSGTLTSPTFTIVANETYRLDFLMGAFGDGTETITIQIGAFTFTLPVPGVTNLDTAFQPNFVQFTQNTGGSAAIQISAAGGFNIDAFIDNLVFTTTAPPTTAPVPEPSTWAMILLGFGALGTAMRRRRRAALA